MEVLIISNAFHLFSVNESTFTHHESTMLLRTSNTTKYFQMTNNKYQSEERYAYSLKENS